MTKIDPNKNLSFEDAYIQLEKTVRALEAGGISLDEAAQLYEKGMKLTKICNLRLSAAELKVSRLQRSFVEHTGFVTKDESL
jgi:exodeoxyribonuclease VII small subunit